MTPPDRGLRRALEVAGVPLAVLDHEGLVESVNAQFAGLFGSTVESLVGQHLISLCDPGATGPITSALVRIIGGVSTVEMATIQPDNGRSVTLTFTPSHHDDDTESVIFCVANPTVNPTTDRPGRPDPEVIHQPAVDGTPGDADDDLTAHVAASIERSGRYGKPFALLIAELNDSDGSTVDEETSQIVAARILQRLRSSDSVIHRDAARMCFLAERLGTMQDAVGVAYRMLSTTVDPIRTATGRQDVSMTIGIAVGDGGASTERIVAAGREALESAMSDGHGGFRTIDTRPHGDSDEHGS